MIKRVSCAAAAEFLAGNPEGIKPDGKADHWGVFKDGRLVAIAAIQRAGARRMIFKTNYVDPAYRGMGHFKELLAFCLVQARRSGVKSVEATCLPSSIREYLRNGFRITRKFKDSWRVRLVL